MYDESLTYSVEAVKTDLRHYLARLGWRPRCIETLRQAVDVFMHSYSAPRLRKYKYPRYPVPLTPMI